MQAIALLRDMQERRTPVYVQHMIVGLLVCVAGLVTEVSAEKVCVEGKHGSRVELSLRGATFDYLDAVAAKGAGRADCQGLLVVRTAGTTVNMLVRSQAAPRSVLSGWKEVAGYCGRGVRTVQRWERELQMPVHRPRSLHGPVIALEDELRQWLATRETLAEVATSSGTAAAKLLLMPKSPATAQRGSGTEAAAS